MDTKKTGNCHDSAHSNCKEIINNVFRLLDGEMTETEENIFFEHVKKCPNCLDDYQIEKSFKDFVCHKMNKKIIDPTLIETIKSQIKSMDTAKALIFVATMAKLFAG